MNGSLVLSITDTKGNKISKPSINLYSKGQKIDCSFEEKGKRILMSALDSGQYSLEIKKRGYHLYRREIWIRGSKTEKLTITLGKEDLPYFYHRGAKRPYEAGEQMIGVKINAKENLQPFTRWIEKNKVQVINKIEVGFSLFYLLKLSKSISNTGVRSMISKLKAKKCVDSYGIAVDSKRPVFLTGAVDVEIGENQSQNEVNTAAKEIGLKKVGRIEKKGRKVLRYQSKDLLPSQKFIYDCEKLFDLGVIIIDTPTEQASVGLHAGGETIFPKQWHSQIIRNEEAWQRLNTLGVEKRYGDEKIRIAVADTGIQSNNIDSGSYAIHPEFIGSPNERRIKVEVFYDFHERKRNNNNITSPHGNNVAGIVGGKPHDSGNSIGTTGVIPNSRLFGIFILFDNVTSSEKPKVDGEIFRWLGGLEPNFQQWDSIYPTGTFQSFPNPGDSDYPEIFSPTNSSLPSPDIINNSWTHLPGINPNDFPNLDDGFNYNVRYGRKGKGQLVFFSAGNENGDPSFAPFGDPYDGDIFLHAETVTHESVMAVGATALDNNGEEIHAKYSNFDLLTKQIEFSAPGHDDYLRDGSNYFHQGSGRRETLHKPPEHYRVITNHLLHDGNMPGKAGALESTLLFQPSMGDSHLEVEETDSFVSGQYLFIGDPFYKGFDPTDGSTAEIVQIKVDPNPYQVFPSYTRINLEGSVSSNSHDAGDNFFGIGLSEMVTGNMNVINPGGFDDSITTVSGELVNFSNGIIAVITLTDASGFLPGQRVFILHDSVGGPDSGNGDVGIIKDRSINDLEIAFPESVDVNDFTFDDNNNDTRIFVYGGLVQTELRSAVSSTYNTTQVNIDLPVKTVHGFQPGQAILIGQHEDEKSEAHIIHDIVDAETLKIEPVEEAIDSSNSKYWNLFYSHDQGGQVIGGRPSYTNEMGGTSSACPIASGIAGLILTVNPKLSWLEVKDIMQRTAVPIDLTNYDNLNNSSYWENKNGDPLSDSNGDLIIPTGAPQTQINNSGGVEEGWRFLPVDSVNGFEKRSSIIIEPGSSQEEVRVIHGFDPNSSTFIIDKLRNDHPDNATIKAGRVAHYSPYLGYGRLDAFRAVDEAIAYKHEYRDLMIRDYLDEENIDPTTSRPVQDTGENKTDVSEHPVHSPDIFLKNLEIDSSDIIDASLIGDFDTHAPQENLNTGISEPVFQGGSGNLNDMRVRGIYTGNSSTSFQIKIVTGGNNQTNEIKWREGNSGSFKNFNGIFNDNAIVANEEKLITDGSVSYGVYISFPNEMGHTTGDIWEIQVEPLDDWFLYSRVLNRGNGGPEELNSLGGWVRFYVALSDGDIPSSQNSSNNFPDNTNYQPPSSLQTPFNFPFQWMVPSGITFQDRDKFLIENINHNNDNDPTGENQSYLIGEINGNEFFDQHEVFLPEGIPVFQSSIIAKQAWKVSNDPQSYVPPLDPDFSLKPFLLVQASPFDGPIEGEGAEAVNNLSYREFAFASFVIRDGTGDIMSDVEDLQVNELGTLVIQGIQLDIRSNVGKLNTESTEVHIIKKDTNGAVIERNIWGYDGTSWQFISGAATNLTMNPPTLTRSSTPATGNEFHITFNGNIEVSNNLGEVEVIGVINSTSPVVTNHNHKVPIARDSVKFNVQEISSTPKGLTKGKVPLFPSSFTFTDMESGTALNSQTADDAYGPKDGDETNKFRTTSRFTASSDINAYAITNGFAIVQPQGGTNDRVNLILRPFGQPIPGFQKIKYFVYRGLRKDDFIDQNDDSLVTSQTPLSDWITELRNIHTDLNNGADFLSKALGYDPSNQSDSDPLEQYFFRKNPDFQLPFMAKGTQIGKFDSGTSFGIDIVLEERKFLSNGSFVWTPDLGYARQEFHEVDVSGMSGGFDEKVEREKILGFMDPAAFYGLHHTDEGEVKRPDGSGGTEVIPKGDLFDDVIGKFATKNKLYVDIRNDQNDSLNFFGNYDDSGNPIETGTTSGNLSSQPYGSHQWPILIFENTNVSTNQDFNERFFKFRVEDNIDPLLFVEHGKIQPPSQGTSFLEGPILYSGSGSFTEEVGFSFPNTGPSNSKDNVAWLLKLYFGRRLAPSTSWPNTVVQTDYYADNVFGPINATPPFESNAVTQWDSFGPKHFVDEPNFGFAHMAQRGIAFDKANGEDRWIFFATASDIYTSAGKFKAKGGEAAGIDTEESLFGVERFLQEYDLRINTINPGPNQKIVVLNFSQADPLEQVPEQNAQVLGITDAEMQVLRNIQGFDSRYPRTIALEKLGSFTDQNGKPYSQFKLAVQGLDDTNQEFLKSFPQNQDIEVYTTDELFFASESFTDNEPLPSSYIPNVEETNGKKLKHPAKKLDVDSVDQGNNIITVLGKEARELVKDEEIKIDSISHTVVSASSEGIDKARIEVSSLTISSANEVEIKELTWEDRFILLDQNTSISSPSDKMGVLVQDFIDAVNATPDNESAPSLLDTEVDNYADKILRRARAFVNENFSSNPNPDDRILYWARLKMKVALKSHPYLLGAITEKEQLVNKFEKLSRGISNVDFSPAGSTTKKVLITGFDPFDILEGDSNDNILKSNPSGAAALYLHGKDNTDLGVDAFIQTAILPVRFDDFDEGIIDEFFDQFINTSQVDMIITLSEGREERYDVERWAGKFRSPTSDDNENKNARGQKLFVPDNGSITLSKDPGSLPEFLETNLPFEDMVSANSSEYQLQQGKEVFNQGFDSDQNDRNKSNPGEPDPIAANPGVPAPNANSIEGSGGAFLSNEVFYRVSLLKEKRGVYSSISSGLIHLPKLQNKVPGSDRPKDFDSSATKEMIEDLKQMIIDGINGL